MKEFLRRLLPPKSLEPKLLTVFREGYSRQHFVSDLTAGVIVGIVALPLAIAFAIASGVKPEQGIFTAIIGAFIVAGLGGSRVQIAGPTGAFIVIVYSVVQQHGYEGLAVATLIAGVMLVVMGLARFGTLLKFIPYPLTVGFTSGIALIIFSSQLRDFLGFRIDHLPADFLEKWTVYAEHIDSIDPTTIAIGTLSLLIILVWPKVSRRVPGSLVAILGVTALVHLLHIPVATIESRFGPVPTMLPAPQLPQVSWSTVTKVFSPAITIALLGAIESLLSAVVADGMIRSRHRSNTELVAQGAANILSPLFSGIPVTGAIARTATNIKSGGRTPVAGMIHSAVLLLIMIVFGQWAALIPLATLAAILLVVAYNMSEWHSFVRILKSPRSDIAIMLITFALTVIIDLTVAIEVGVVLAALLFMKRMAEVSKVTPLTRDLLERDEDDELKTGLPAVPPEVEVFEVYGSLFFGVVDQFTESLRSGARKPGVVILEMRHLLAIDATGLRALENLAIDLSRQGTRLLIASIHKQPLYALQHSHVMRLIGDGNLCGDLAEALRTAQDLLKAGTNPG